MTVRLRGWLLVVATLALVATLVATGGFSSTNANRGVEVSVADDGNAYVELTNKGVSTNGDQTDVTLVTVGNRAGEASDVTVTDSTVEDSGVNVTNIAGPGPVADDADGNVTADVECPSGGGTADVTLDLKATGDTVEATLTRTVTVECTN